MRINVLSPDFRTLGVISKYTSLIHTKQFAGSGSFTLKAYFTRKLFRILAEDNIIYWEDSGKAYAAYIVSVVCETVKKRKVITATGKNLRGYLDTHIVWNNLNFTGAVEKFARTVVDQNFISPADPGRKIPLLMLGDERGYPDELTRATEHEIVEKLLDEITAESYIGFDIILDRFAKKLIFVTYKGINRGISQKETPWVIVSQDRNNVVTSTYTRSRAMYRNTALIGGMTHETTGVQDTEQIIEGEGLFRREMFIKASGCNNKPLPGETQAEADIRYRAEMMQAGREGLAVQVDIKTLEVELDPELLPKIDVGDIVTAIDEDYGLTMETHISEITTYYEKGGRSYDVTLGAAVPTEYEKLKKEIV